MIRLQRIYKFFLFHAVILSFLDVLQSFYSNLISFLGPTYWHSAKVPVAVFACFLLCRKSIPNGVQSRQNFLEIFSGLEDTQWAKEVPGEWAEETTTHQAAPGGPGAPWWVVPSSRPHSTASNAYKFPNIPKTLGESTKHNSSRRKFQNLEIQSKHHHGGVHLPHRCLSDDAWVVQIDLRVRRQ